MNEFEDIQRLIRLKRFEQPEEGFTENFLQQFHERQRAELLKQSSVELLMERVTTWWNHLLVPKWSMATAGLAVCALSAWMFVRPVEKPGSSVTTATPAATDKTFVPKMDLSGLPKPRPADDAALAEMTRKQQQATPALDGKATPSPLPTSGWEKPTSKNAIPAVQNGTEGGLGK